MTTYWEPSACTCLDRCRQERALVQEQMASLMVGGAYCRKTKGEPFKHRPLSDMERRQIEAAQQADEVAAKELSIAQQKVRDAENRRALAAEVLNHWVSFTANPEAKPK